jgi:DNA-binding GntR family transcriptional regulator
LSQRDTAYLALRQRLILQQVAQGERLREPEWAETLGVNRAALREAFARLEAEGLIARGQKTGYFVPILTEQDIREVLHIRRVLECEAINLIAQADPPTNLQPLQQACDELEMLITSGYLIGVTEADRRFHEALIDLADQRRLKLIYRRAPLPMIHEHVAGTPAWQAECHQTLDEHRAIVDAMQRGKFDRATKLLTEHLGERFVEVATGAMRNSGSARRRRSKKT